MPGVPPFLTLVGHRLQVVPQLAMPVGPGLQLLIPVRPGLQLLIPVGPSLQLLIPVGHGLQAVPIQSPATPQ